MNSNNININSSASPDLIINLGGEDYQTMSLKSRIINKKNYNGHEVYILKKTPQEIYEDPKDEDLKLFSKIDQFSKIYVLDHGARNSQFISVHFSGLSNYLSKCINENSKQKIIGKCIKISLLSCHGAVGKNECVDDSFAALFHHHLYAQNKIETEVNARNRVVMVNSHTNTTGKLTAYSLNYGIISTFSKPSSFFGVNNFVEKFNHLNKQPGSKVTVKWANNKSQVIQDAYLLKVYESTKKFVKETLQDIPKSLLDIISDDLDNLVLLSSNTNAVTIENVKNISDCYNEILSKISSMNSVNSKEVASRVEFMLNFISKSVSKDKYIKTIWTGRNQLEDFKSDDDLIVKNIHEPILKELRKMPKTSSFEEGPEKESMGEFKTTMQKELLQFISDNAKIKMQKGADTSKERFISLSMKYLIKEVCRENSSREYKIIFTKNMVKTLKNRVNPGLKGVGPSMRGFASGINRSKETGGWQGLRYFQDYISQEVIFEKKFSEDFEKKIDLVEDATLKFIEIFNAENN